MTNWVRVIVTCYNHQDYIQECLESIFNQTYPYIRLSVFDDGSTDNSKLVIQKLVQHSPLQCDFHSHPNQGLVKTRNLALDTYQGKEEYILFVDSDNFLEPNYIEAMVEVAERGADLVYVDLVNPDDDSLVVKAIPFDLATFYSDNFIDSCSLIRQDIIGDCRYDTELNYKKLEDYDFFFQLIVQEGAVANHCPTTFLNYRVLANSMSARNDLKKYYDVYFYILGKYFSYYPNLAQKALMSNYQRLYQAISLEGKYLSERAIIYFSQTLEFNNKDKLEFPLDGREVSFTISDEVNYLRLDLSELPSYYKFIRLVDVNLRTELLPVDGNFIGYRECYFFNQNDPQLIFDLRGRTSREFELNYELANIHDLLAEDFLLKRLTSDLIEKEKQGVELSQSRRQNVKLEKENEELKRQLEAIIFRYNSVVSSRRWTIPTKIIDFFRRKK